MERIWQTVTLAFKWWTTWMAEMTLPSKEKAKTKECERELEKMKKTANFLCSVREWNLNCFSQIPKPTPRPPHFICMTCGVCKMVLSNFNTIEKSLLRFVYVFVRESKRTCFCCFLYWFSKKFNVLVFGTGIFFLCHTFMWIDPKRIFSLYNFISSFTKFSAVNGFVQTGSFY